MSNPSDFTARVRNDRDIVISKPKAGFEVTYRREVYYPMLIASEVMKQDFDESKVTLFGSGVEVSLGQGQVAWLA